MQDHIFTQVIIRRAQRELETYKQHVDEYGKKGAWYYSGALSGIHSTLIVLNQGGDLETAEKAVQAMVDEAIAYMPKEK